MEVYLWPNSCKINPIPTPIIVIGSMVYNASKSRPTYKIPKQREITKKDIIKSLNSCVVICI